MSVDLDGNLQMVVELPDLPTAHDWTADGRMLIVSANARRLLSLENGELVTAADMSGLVSHACGELVIDKHGRAYVGNIGFDFGTEPAVPNPGSILLVMPGGKAQIVAEGLGFPNGMVITPDGRTLIVAESYNARLTAFAIEADGTLSHSRPWAQFDESLPFEDGRFTPDGICLDAEGAVWVASPGEVVRIHEGAQIANRVPIDGFPLACMLGGPERRTLFILITSTQNPMDGNVSGRIETIKVDVPGAGLPYTKPLIQ
jgi:sugar lactone lactonase YvrE